MSADSRYGFYEFFCGGGMARLGLGRRWRCDFANDIDPDKLAAYRANFGDDDLRPGDVAGVAPDELPGFADLAWASFPCQDLSLAGPRSGLKGARSGVFYSFWRLIEALQAEGRAPRLIGLENVPGLLTCSGGDDFTALCAALDEGGYRFGALEIDARWFTPQSRPRLFVIALRKDIPIPADLALDDAPGHLSPFHTGAVQRAARRLPEPLKKNWVWWALPVPPRPNETLIHKIEAPRAVPWHSPEETRRLVEMMNAPSRARLREARKAEGPVAGALYRRMRVENGVKVQRAEARFDGLAGCLRTPGGGSSRQFVVWVRNGRVRTRPMTAREYARLMGLPEDYKLPARESAALHLSGDGVSVDVVAFLRENLFEPVLDHARACALAAE
ncbi:DNA cytosine methyltransferase [Alkalicaulis satelles]|nr:DNA cytosine methyltransferase [Alkalicaulis satelles]